jgi:hypothetical protein
MKVGIGLLAVAALLASVAAAPAAAEDLSPEALLAQYQPMTVLSQGELFAPTTVEDFLADASLLRQADDGSFQPAEMPEAGLPVYGNGWRLDHRCMASGGLVSAAQCYVPASHGPSTLYGRYEVIAGSTVLQYWLFYEHNVWTLPGPFFGAAWQAHEGDWEVVQVVLDDKRTPVEAAYSQHCAGQRRAWETVPKLSGTSHPIVFVGRGSHANFFTPGLHPIARSCVPAPALRLFDAAGITPVDVNVPGVVLGPGSTAVERVHDNAPRWLRFPGTWGEAQYLAAPIFGIPPTAFGTSPVGPAFQNDWLDPLGTIAGYPVG